MLHIPDATLTFTEESGVPHTFVQAFERNVLIVLTAHVIAIEKNSVTIRFSGRPITIVNNLKDGAPFDATA